MRYHSRTCSRYDFHSEFPRSEAGELRSIVDLSLRHKCFELKINSCFQEKNTPIVVERMCQYDPGWLQVRRLARDYGSNLRWTISSRLSTRPPTIRLFRAYREHSYHSLESVLIPSCLPVSAVTTSYWPSAMLSLGTGFNIFVDNANCRNNWGFCRSQQELVCLMSSIIDMELVLYSTRIVWHRTVHTIVSGLSTWMGPWITD